LTLTPGTRLGPYEVTAQIGEGGMGVVWRATDTNLKRAVALKVLPEAVAADRDRLARFQREAEVLAALNHPNIAHIHGLEKSGGTTALVMELVEGPTLADRIARGALPVDEALAIAKQIAEALEAAHEQGIVHRDLKPANVKVRDDGTVKVLDFGLAKALEPTGGATEISHSPTITSPAMTQAGMILGTAAYMSPEQARGKPVDKRTDIWAFGCVLYEMLTGRRAFEGDDVTETLAAIVKTDPDFTRVPESLRRVLASCLDKNPKTRLRDIGDAWHLRESPSPRPGARSRIVPLVGLGGLATLNVILYLMFRPASVPTVATPARFAHVLGDAEEINPSRQLLSISRDGSMFAYTASGRLSIRRLDELEARQVSGAVGLNAYEPMFSPDSRWIAFVSGRDQTLVKTPIDGGPTVVICKISPDGVFGADWGTSDQIVYSASEGLMSVSAQGGTPRLVVSASKEEAFDTPRFLPDGRTLLYTAKPRLATMASWPDARVMAASIDGANPKLVLERAFDARYVQSGHLIYGVGPSLMAVRFDPKTASATGHARPVLQQVRRGVGPSFGTSYVAVSETGTLAYMPPYSPNRQLRRLVWVDRNGHEEPILSEPRPYTGPRIAPNGNEIAFSIRDGGDDIWILNTTTKRLRQLTSDAAPNYVPAWSPNSKRVVFASLVDGTTLRVFSQAADGSGSPEPVAPPASGPGFPFDVLRDGRILYGDLADIGVLSPNERHWLIRSPATETNADLSPDQRFIAYQSDRTGQFEIYVRSLDNIDAGEWPISRQGGISPRWSADGKEIFYWRANGATASVMAARVVPNATFQTEGPPQELFSGAFDAPGWEWDPMFDVAPDGRFLMMKAHGTPLRPQITIVTNWLEELKRLVPTQ
jgi:eukaryotic-like serine/threonine-protein kinase